MKYDWEITLILTGLFLVSQVLGLGILYGDLDVISTPDGPQVVHPPTAIGERPDVDTESGESVLFILSGVFLGTILLLLIIRFGQINAWKLLFFIAVITTITISLGVFLPALWALLIAAILTFLKIFRSNIVVHNVTEIFIYAGIAVLFVPLFNLFWITILLLAISAYDAFAVWQSKHMIKLAQFQTGSRLFAGFFVSRKEKAKGAKAKITKKVKGAVKRGKMEKVRAREAILGGGDIAFPLIFAGVVMESLAIGGKLNAFLLTLAIPVVLTLVLLGLLIKGEQGKFYPAMPFLTAACLIGAGIVFAVAGLF